MFLISRIRRQLRAQRRRSEEGAALVTVVALVAITSVVTLATASSVFAANGVTTLTRASVQSKAAAEAGIDWAYGQFTAGTYPCTYTQATDPAFSVRVAYTTSAGGALPCSGATVSGSPAAATVVSTGTAANRGTQSPIGDEYAMGAKFAVTPATSTTTTTGTTLTLDNAVFSSTTISTTNGNQFLASAPGANDANMYAAGNVSCATQVPVQGSIQSQGNVSLANGCYGATGVWAGGSVGLGDNTTIGGDVYSASSTAINLNTNHIEGSVLTNGSVAMSNGAVKTCGTGGSWGVCGSVVALGGGITLNNGANIKGSAYAKGDIQFNTPNDSVEVGTNALSATGSITGSNLGNGKKVVGWAQVGNTITIDPKYIGNTGSSCQKTAAGSFTACAGALSYPALNPAQSLPGTLGYPAAAGQTPVIQAPPRQGMPRIPQSQLAPWTAAGWNIVHFNAVTALQYALGHLLSLSLTSCEEARAYITSQSWTTKTLLVVDDCPWGVPFNNDTITMKADLAVMNGTGFGNYNNLTIKSSGTATHQLMFVVPSDGDLINWLQVGQVVQGIVPLYIPNCNPLVKLVGSLTNLLYPDISLNNVSVTNTKVLLYTPCTLKLTNTITGFTGQIYGGSVSTGNNGTYTMAKLDIPGVTTNAGTAATITHTTTTDASATLQSRYDVSG